MSGGFAPTGLRYADEPYADHRAFLQREFLS